VLRADIPPPLAQPIVTTIEDLVAMVAATAKSPQIFHRDGEIVLLFDQVDRREWATMKLADSSAFKKLRTIDVARELGMLTMHEHVAFCRLLKLTLGVDEASVAPFRRIDWRSSDATQSNAKRGDEAVSAAVLNKIDNIADLPEELTLVLPVYEGLDVDRSEEVRCLIEVEPSSRRLGIFAAPGEIRRAVDKAQMNVRERIKERLAAMGSECLVFYGTP
jgi:hypothetical protein